MPIISVEGRKLEAKAGSNLLQALLSAGKDLPYFCWHPSMGSIGACRQCAVIQYANEEDTKGRIVMACMTPVADGARIDINAPRASAFRQAVIENLMLNHPHDCPVCEEGGECHLQDMTVMTEHRDRRYAGKKNTFRNQQLGPLISHEMNRCITCYRCVRYYQDYAGGNDLNAFASRDRVFFGRAEDGVLENEFAGNLVEVCPTGVFTDKPLSKHYSRKWDLQSAPTICTGCGLGCNTYSAERYGQLRRIHNRYNEHINGYFLCDRGRFGGDYVNSAKRIPQAGIRNAKGTYDALPVAAAIENLHQHIMQADEIIGIGSPRASLEANQALIDLVGKGNYSSGMSAVDQEMHGLILDVLRSQLHVPSLAEVESCDAILILGEDITNHSPRLALAIRQASRNRALAMAAECHIPSWHDAAVREIGQGHRNPIFVCTPHADRLDDIAKISLRLSPAAIARQGFALADLIGAQTATESDLSATTTKLQQIASLLCSAKQPLIISGTSFDQPNILRAAANIALCLTQRNSATKILMCPSECNSMGAAMLNQQTTIESLLDRSPDLVIVLENDLHRRLDRVYMDKLREVSYLCVCDHLDNTTASASHIILPAATFAEAEGTYINYEGRAQHAMAVFKPRGDIGASYHLLDAARQVNRSAEQIRSALIKHNPGFEQLHLAAPAAGFRIEGAKIPRMTHRASGRTAMLANVSVHEPKQPVDNESAMAFSMEGNQQSAPADLRAYNWAPGWNSNQSIHKFQAEVGGHDLMGNGGARIIAKQAVLQPYPLPRAVSDAHLAAPYLIAKHHIFGSEPLSYQADAIAQLGPKLYVMLNQRLATDLHLTEHDGISCRLDETDISFTLIITEDVADNCMVYPLLKETQGLRFVQSMQWQKLADWAQPADRPLIASDRKS